MGRKKPFKLLATVTQTSAVSSGEPFENLQNVCGNVEATHEEAEAEADRAVLQRADSTDMQIVDFLAYPLTKQIVHTEIVQTKFKSFWEFLENDCRQLFLQFDFENLPTNDQQEKHAKIC